MEWYMSESGVKPKEIDKDISKINVYLRRNIEYITRQDEMGGEYSMWQYEECVMPRAEYAIWVAERADAKVDYLTILSDAEIEEE